MDLLDAARNVNKTHENDVLKKLFTPWGETIDPEHVLPEYPRPQLVRESYINLNGWWDYQITRTGRFPNHFAGRILVPFSPESLLSGVERQLKPGEYLWYRRALTVGASPFADGRLLLHFGAVDQYAAIYVNRKKVTEHRGGYLPFEADITDYLREGENTLVAAVQDSSDTSFHSRGKQRLKRGGMFYTAQSGIWQTVWMEWVPRVYVRSLRITPNYDRNSVTISLNINNRAQSGPLPLQVSVTTGPSSVYVCANCPPGGRTCSQQDSVEVKLTDRRDWTPEDPFLYPLEIRLGEDRITSYFAMRLFTVEKDETGILRFCLNHRPLFLNGVLDQGYWPDGLYTAPSDEALIYDITAMKNFGYNLMRKHAKIEAARWYYHCDRLGMIVFQDIVSGGSRYSMPMVCYLPTLFPNIAARISDGNYKLFSREQEKGRREWEKECMDTVEQLYNAPCIAAWVPFNEGWGQFDANRITGRMKQADPTRLVDQASGWFDQGGGDFKSEHNYFRRLKVTTGSRAYLLSEYGGYACHIEEHSSVSRVYGYRKFDTCGELQEAYRKLIQETLPPLIRQGLCGAVYTQVSDVEEEVNGILTYDRKVNKLQPVPLP